MSRIHDIPVVVVRDRRSASAEIEPNHSLVLAILNEIDEKLNDLLISGEESTVDLRWLMTSQTGLSLLREILGRGEVAASVAASGNTEVQETAVPCLWWISHHDINNRLVGVFLEITEIPELLRSDRLSIHRGLVQLRARGADLLVPDRSSSAPSLL